MNFPSSQQGLWEQPVAEPEFAAFKEWTERYRQASGTEAKAGLEAEGLRIARVRLTALADLIQSNPQRALELAVPFTVRTALPVSVQALLEEQVNTRGDYQVLAVLPSAEHRNWLPPVVRAATITGQQYEVFTYVGPWVLPPGQTSPSTAPPSRRARRRRRRPIPCFNARNCWPSVQARLESWTPANWPRP